MFRDLSRNGSQRDIIEEKFPFAALFKKKRKSYISNEKAFTRSIFP